VSFAYWTDGVFDPSTATSSDTAPTMVTPRGKVAPVPWVPFTRAGCDVGSVAAANTILENTGPDVPIACGGDGHRDGLAGLVRDEYWDEAQVYRGRPALYRLGVRKF